MIDSPGIIRRIIAADFQRTPAFRYRENEVINTSDDDDERHQDPARNCRYIGRIYTTAAAEGSAEARRHRLGVYDENREFRAVPIDGANGAIQNEAVEREHEGVENVDGGDVLGANVQHEVAALEAAPHVPHEEEIIAPDVSRNHDDEEEVIAHDVSRDHDDEVDDTNERSRDEALPAPTPIHIQPINPPAFLGHEPHSTVFRGSDKYQREIDSVPALNERLKECLRYESFIARMPDGSVVANSPLEANKIFYVVRNPHLITSNAAKQSLAESNTTVLITKIPNRNYVGVALTGHNGRFICYSDLTGIALESSARSNAFISLTNFENCVYAVFMSARPIALHEAISIEKFRGFYPPVHDELFVFVRY